MPLVDRYFHKPCPQLFMRRRFIEKSIRYLPVIHYLFELLFAKPYLEIWQATKMIFTHMYSSMYPYIYKHPY